MEQTLLTLLRGSGLETICRETNGLAEEQRQQALSGLKLFTLPTPKVESKEDYYNMSKAERVQWQKAKEAERRRLNKEQGIDGKALLTVENVERWRAEGKTYASIAREIVGCADWQVAEVLKEQGGRVKVIRRRGGA